MHKAQEIVQVVSHVLHAAKFVVIELMFFGWGLWEIGKFALATINGGTGIE